MHQVQASMLWVAHMNISNALCFTYVHALNSALYLAVSTHAISLHTSMHYSSVRLCNVQWLSESKLTRPVMCSVKGCDLCLRSTVLGWTEHY